MSSYNKCITIFSLLLLTVTGCSNLHKVSAGKFVAILERSKASMGNTFPDYAYIIGTTPDRVYLEYRPGLTIFEPATRVYWTSLADIPDNIRTKILNQKTDSFYLLDPKMINSNQIRIPTNAIPDMK